MAKGNSKSPVPNLREFVAEYDEPLYTFCWLMLNNDQVEELVLSVFRNFSVLYRKGLDNGDGSSSQHGFVCTTLFQIAWEMIRNSIYGTPTAIQVGRDMRPQLGLEDDILATAEKRPPSLKPARTMDTDLQKKILERLTLVDPDFRAPVILRDILNLDDAVVSRILGIRWGVYRHRLHRGRIEFSHYLRGSVPKDTLRGSSP